MVRKAAKIRADALRRADLAFQLRESGHTWDECARRSGYASASTAQRAVTQLLDRALTQNVEHQRVMWRGRIERVWEKAYANVLAGKPGASAEAMKVVNTAMQRRCSVTALRCT